MSDRNRDLCRLLLDHRVLTTQQVTEVAFDSVNAAQHRLVTLYRLRVLDRFRPLRLTGSAPFHYVLDEMGVAIIAAERGIGRDELGYRRDKALALAHSQRLVHTVGVNGFFTALIGAARRSPSRSALTEWWSERRCAATWGHTVRPDGYGCWREGGEATDFFLEYDRGTETLDRLVEKLDRYAKLQAASQITTLVLLWLPNPRREEELLRRVHRPRVPLATASPALGGPAGAVWCPSSATTTSCRVRLAALPRREMR